MNTKFKLLKGGEKLEGINNCNVVANRELHHRTVSFLASDDSRADMFARHNMHVPNQQFENALMSHNRPFGKVKKGPIANDPGFRYKGFCG